MDVKIIAILNLTPDSFSDGGKYSNAQAAFQAAKAYVGGGADLVELGGEATGPGSSPVSEAEELSRLTSTIDLCRSGDIPFAVDTYKEGIARMALEQGAVQINDVSALRVSPGIAKLVAQYGAKLVLMHNKENHALPHVSESGKEYGDIISDICNFLFRRVEVAISYGCSEENLILDPGMGRFLSDRTADSFELLRRFDELVERLKPFPVMVATSRKGFLGGVSQDRDPLSQLTALSAHLKGAKYVRTHNPAMMREFLRGWKEINRC